jgi:hypothetical protein
MALSGLFQTIRGAITGGGIETAPYTVLRKEKVFPLSVKYFNLFVQFHMCAFTRNMRRGFIQLRNG